MKLRVPVVASALRRATVRLVAIALAAGTVITTASCTTMTRAEYEDSRKQSAPGKGGFDGSALGDLFFDVYWDSKVLRDAGEAITYFELIDDAIYVFTDKNSLYSFDYNSGMVRWKYDLGGELSFPISVYNYPPEEKERIKVYDEVYMITKDVIFAIDKENGSLLWKKALPFSCASGPVASQSHVYVGSWDDRLYGIEKNSRRSTWFWRTDEDITTRVAEKSPAVYVCGEDGIVYSFDAQKGGPPNWTFHAERSIVVDPLLYRNRLYVGSDDMNIYSIGILDGLLEWRYPTGAPIVRKPVGIRNTIYVVSEDNRLDAIHRRKGRTQDGKVYREGELKWSYPLGDQVLGKGRENIYIVARRDGGLKLVALDEEEGFVRFDDDGRIADQIDYFVTNDNDPLSPISSEAERGGILYFGFRNGLIIAIKERVKY